VSGVLASAPGALVDWHALAPYLVLAATMALVALAFAGRSAPSERAQGAPVAGALAGATAAIALFLSLLARGGTRRLFDGRFVVGSVAAAIGMLAAVGAYVTIVVVVRRAGRAEPAGAAFAAIGAALGVAGLAAARDVLLAVVSLELVAVSLTFALAAAVDPMPGRGRRHEGFTAGLVALSVEAYGVAMVVVVCGSTRFARMGDALHGPHQFAGVVAVVVLAGAAIARAAGVVWCWWAPAAGKRSGSGMRSRSSV
jgi:NADH:ubiquinone oxidoreductase subunit K